MERNELMQDEEEFERQGFLDRFKSMFSGGDHYEDEMDDEAPAPTSRSTASSRPLLRMDSARNAIYVRKEYRTMEDAVGAANRLKERRPVIVNFAHADPEMARRGVDFISGVVHALDGYYEKVSDHVFLFTPMNLAITPEGPEEADRSADVFGNLR